MYTLLIFTKVTVLLEKYWRHFIFMESSQFLLYFSSVQILSKAGQKGSTKLETNLIMTKFESDFSP